MILNTAKTAEMGVQIRELVETGLARKGVSARRASMDVVGHDGLIRDIRAGRIPSFDRLVTLFEYLSIPFSFDHENAAQRGLAEDPPPLGTPGFEGREALRAGFLPFPWHRVSRRRGMGPVAFASDWVEERGLTPENLSFVEPDTVLAGKNGPNAPLVLLDQGGARSGGPALWCFIEAGRVVLARLDWQGRDILTITGDQSDLPARVLIGADRDHVQVLGRAIWTGNSI